MALTTEGTKPNPEPDPEDIARLENDGAPAVPDERKAELVEENRDPRPLAFEVRETDHDPREDRPELAF